MMLVSNPSLHAKTVTAAVETAQVAPTILAALGLDPGELQAVQIEGTAVLPGLFEK
jgi:arylsulfatase A-like enzyme